MYKIIKWILPTLIVAQAAWLIQPVEESPYLQPQQVDNFSFVANRLLQSSRYTQPDDYDSVILNRFTEDYQLTYEPEELINLGFLTQMEDAFTIVYFEPKSFSVLIKDKATGYYFSSRPEFQGMSGTREDNTASRNLMNSGLWIETLRTNNISSSAIRIESLYTLAGVGYENNGAQDLENIDPTKPYILEAGSYKDDLVQVVINNTNPTSIETSVFITNYGLSFDITLALINGSFEVFFSPETVSETSDIYRMTGIQFFPYLASMREDVYPGYFVIPDGVGALIRSNRRYDTFFQSDYYGSDLGYLRESVASLSLPIFGLIHAVDQYGLMAEVIEGSQHSTLLAQFWGRNTRYHRMTNRFNLRRIFRNIINRAGDGNDVIPEEVVNQNYRVQDHTLINDQANYVGVAKRYQQSLLGQNVLLENEFDRTPLHTSYLIAEQEPTFFGTSQVTMTSYQQASEMYQTLVEEGIDRHVTSIMGWSRDGLTFRAPYRTNYIDRNGLVQFTSMIKEDGGQVYLDQEYMVSSELSQRVNYNNDVSRNYSKLKMASRSGRLDNQGLNIYQLYPQTAVDKMLLDVNSISNIGVDGLSMNRFGNTLYSFYDGQRRSRSVTLDILDQAKDAYNGFALSRPNAYMFDVTKAYLDLPVTNSQFDLYTDLAPIIPIVLKGYTPMFTPYLNFNALGKDRLLQMIDFGVNPSYLLTEQMSSLLRYTYSNRYYTTAFSDFKDNILNTYAYVSQALDHVQRAEIIERDMLEVGVSRVTYNNGVTIYINYRQSPVTIDQRTIAPLDYEVVLP